MDVQELMGRVTKNLSVERSFGKPYEKDGTMVIPVVMVAGGGGGGEGTAGAVDTEEPETLRDSSERHGDSATGWGGGFGGVVIPVGAYVVKDERVRWIPAVNVNVVILAGLVLMRILVRSRARARRHRH